MPVSVSTPSSLPAAPALPSWKTLLAFCTGLADRTRTSFSRIDSGTTLTQDPFSAEHSRD